MIALAQRPPVVDLCSVLKNLVVLQAYINIYNRESLSNYDLVSVNVENPATVSKCSISSYFAQMNPLVSYFRKHN